jgi:hypothetical protein
LSPQKCSAKDHKHERWNMKAQDQDNISHSASSISQAAFHPQHIHATGRIPPAGGLEIAMSGSVVRHTVGSQIRRK